MTRRPLPAEHGSWALLACAYGLGLCVAPTIRAAPAVLMAILLISVQLLRAAFSAATGRRPRPGAWLWTCIWALLAAASTAPLLTIYGAAKMLWVAPIAASGVAAHIRLARRPDRKRLDRSTGGEVMAMALLALAAPASYLALSGEQAWAAAACWACIAVVGASGVVYVKMLLSAGRFPNLTRAELRARCGRTNLAYHGALAVALLSMAAATPGPAVLWAAVGAFPLLVRSWNGYRGLSASLPRFVRVGLWESARAAWFTGFAAAALRTLL